MKDFRLLKATEIDCRVQSCGKSQNGSGGWCSLLLYKDARVDQRLLDEMFGPFGWQRKHEVVNNQLCCTVSIRSENGEWVEKQDVGTESNTEAVKGQFSDSFKRACFNWGIGRELYSAPTIFINLTDAEMQNKNGRWQVKSSVNFIVSDIGYDSERNINTLVIKDNRGVVRYKLGDVVNCDDAQQGPTLSEVMDTIKLANSRAELTKIYNSNPQLQSNQAFIEALSARQNEINDLNSAA